MTSSRLITIAIHTYDRASELKNTLEAEGIPVTLQNVNLENPVVASGMRVRIPESDLPLALRIIENPHVFTSSDTSSQESSHYILVPIDFTDYSFRALCDAIRIAASVKADVCVLHSFIDPDEPGAMQLAPTLSYESTDLIGRMELEQETTREVKKFVDRATELMKRGLLPPVKIIQKVVEGVPEDVISEYASVNPPMLIVMGTRGAYKKEKDLIGSVTAEVLDECRYSILAIPEGARSKPSHTVENVVFFTNLDQEDLVAIDCLKRLLPQEGVKISLINITGKKRLLKLRQYQTDIESIYKYCREHYPDYEFSSKTIDATNVIEDVDKIFEGMGIDIIVIPNKKKKNVFTRMFSPSLAQKILFHSERPILAIPV